MSAKLKKLSSLTKEAPSNPPNPDSYKREEKETIKKSKKKILYLKRLPGEGGNLRSKKSALQRISTFRPMSSATTTVSSW